MKRAMISFLVLFGVCALLFAEVKTDYDHHADFSRYHTYSWLKVQAGNQLWMDRIQRDIDATLQEKGWQRVDTGGNAGITAFGASENQQSLETFYDGFGGGWFWRGFGPDMATTNVINTPVGTLHVDIFDSSTKHLIWRGSASNTLSGDPEKNEKKLASTVQDMFKHFPPEPKG
jgi:Domain of unknown function (DUF4136)